MFSVSFSGKLNTQLPFKDPEIKKRSRSGSGFSVLVCLCENKYGTPESTTISEAAVLKQMHHDSVLPKHLGDTHTHTRILLYNLWTIREKEVKAKEERCFQTCTRSIMQMIKIRKDSSQSIIQVEGEKRDSRLTHNGIIAGKLNGQIPAQTPSGSLMLYVSIPFDTLETYSPIWRVAVPQACSTTSE